MSLIRFDGMCPDDKLIESGVNVKPLKGHQKETFVKNKQIDQKNEKRPEASSLEAM
jgi:hypothetical protein